MVSNSVVESLQLTLKNLQRQHRVSIRSNDRSDNGNKIRGDLAGQIIAIQMSIQHFSK